MRISRADLAATGTNHKAAAVASYGGDGRVRMQSRAGPSGQFGEPGEVFRRMKSSAGVVNNPAVIEGAAKLLGHRGAWNQLGLMAEAAIEELGFLLE